MTEFKWEGRTGDGQRIQGTLSAQSKDEVEQRLKEMGVTLLRLDEVGPASRAVMDYAARMERKPKPRRDLLWLGGVLVVLGGIGGAIAYYAPLVSVRCNRANGTVSCTAVGSIAGVVPLWTRRLDEVVSVSRRTSDIDPKELTTERARRATITRYETITFLNRRDEPLALPQAGGTFGDTSTDLEQRFTRFLQDESEGTVSGWQGQWVPAIASLAFLFIAGCLLLAVVVSLIAPARVEAASLGLTRKRQRRRHP